METEKRNSLSTLVLAFGVAVVLLAPLAVYVILRSQEGGPGLRQVTSAAEPAANHGQRPSPSTRRVFAPDESEVKRPASRPSPLPPVVVPQPARIPVRMVPAPGDIPIGMDKTKLLATFGKPSMITTEVSEGRALETFHYLKPEAGTETVVQLRSGRVIGAASAYY
jgi:hypothetical protein